MRTAGSIIAAGGTVAGQTSWVLRSLMGADCLSLAVFRVGLRHRNKSTITAVGETC